MANLVYRRVSTDQQSTDRQNLLLTEAGIEGPVTFEEEADTSSRLHPLQRPKFSEPPAYARPGDAVHISDMFRLVRGTQHILDVLDVLHQGRLALRIHDGAFSAVDLTARHPRTGELLSTVKFMVQTLAAAGELRRDLQRELTYDGLRATADRRAPPGGQGRADRRRTRRVPGRPVQRRPRPRARRQPRRHPYGRRRPHARALHRPPGRPGPGAGGHPRYAGQGRRLHCASAPHPPPTANSSPAASPPSGRTAPASAPKPMSTRAARHRPSRLAEDRRHQGGEL
ncbi:recombinase family protein [Streptomyces sp. NPDC059832]|uniref:recombinase family protein n=1 Tax=unclassified Streptomyces TaxID=2593676 RepID=UPI0036690DC5